MASDFFPHRKEMFGYIARFLNHGGGHSSFIPRWNLQISICFCLSLVWRGCGPPTGFLALGCGSNSQLIHGQVFCLITNIDNINLFLKWLKQCICRTRVSWKSSSSYRLVCIIWDAAYFFVVVLLHEPPSLFCICFFSVTDIASIIHTHLIFLHSADKPSMTNCHTIFWSNTPRVQD